MADEISKTTIVVLLVLTILISVIGAWTIMDSINKTRTTGQAGTQNSGTAVITFSVEPKPVQVTGQAIISFSVEKSGGK